MNKKKNIIKTIIYSDIFSFPLTLTEIHRFYSGDTQVCKKDLRKELKDIPDIDERNGYYFLSGKDQLVLERKFRKKESAYKIKKAKWIASLLSHVPTIRYIALSGSLAQQNARQDDDIDLFIITRRNTVWITRLAILAILITTGQKRKKNVVKAPNKICPNMILSEDAICLPENARSLYTARELLQLKTLFASGITQEDLLSRNQWVKNLFPNTKMYQVKHTSTTTHKIEKFINLFDNLAFYLQRKYMGKITNETVKKNLAKFHPRKTGEYIMHLYTIRLKSYEDYKNILNTPQNPYIPTYKN